MIDYSTTVIEKLQRYDSELILWISADTTYDWKSQVRNKRQIWYEFLRTAYKPQNDRWEISTIYCGRMPGSTHIYEMCTTVNVREME